MNKIPLLKLRRRLSRQVKQLEITNTRFKNLNYLDWPSRGGALRAAVKECIDSTEFQLAMVEEAIRNLT